MLRHRLTLGPAMIAGLLLIAWADAALAQQAPPAWLGAALGSEPLPAGLLLTPLGALVALLISLEVARLFRGAGADKASGGVVALAGVAGFLVVGLGVGAIWSATAFALAFASALAWACRTRELAGAVDAAAAALFACVFVGALLGVWLRVRLDDALATMLIGVFVVKASDIGAYFTGSAIGKRKLIPWLSPGKTWEGLVGGAALAAIVALLAALIARDMNWSGVFARAPLWACGLFGAAAAAGGQLSDLVGSALKRAARAKDSARLAPGFGGSLDIVDSLLLTAPLAAAFAALA